jgi:hypothetical protein
MKVAIEHLLGMDRTLDFRHDVSFPREVPPPLVVHDVLAV